MMGRQTGNQNQLFYLFNLEKRIPTSHLLRRINPVVTRVLADLSSRTTGRTHVRCNIISAAKTFSTRCATPSCRRGGSNRLGELRKGMSKRAVLTIALAALLAQPVLART
jgi:hypothetical protein